MKKFFCILTACSFFCMPVKAAPQACTTSEAVAADTAIDHLGTWADTYSAYKQYGKCDSGGISEGFSEGAARLLADHWDELPQGLSLMSANPVFEKWVIHHLNETDDSDDLNKIDASALDHCPADAKNFCIKVHKQILFVTQNMSR